MFQGAHNHEVIIKVRVTVAMGSAIVKHDLWQIVIVDANENNSFKMFNK